MRLTRARIGTSADAPEVDIDIVAGRIDRISATGSTPSASEGLDVEGRRVIPGLWDEHVHMRQWALYRSRLSVLDLGSAYAAAERIALHAATEYGHTRGNGPIEPIVAVGMRDALWSDAPSRALLDAAAPTIPVLVISNDMHSCWLNTTAAAYVGLPVGESGLLTETENFMALSRIAEQLDESRVDALVALAAREAASRGVVGIADLDIDDAVAQWQSRSGLDIRMRVRAGVYPPELALLRDRGLRGGDSLGGLASVGYAKVITDGALGTRTAYCHDAYPGAQTRGMLVVPGKQLDRILATAREFGLTPAVHAIGDAANEAALDAFERARMRGRIEHAQLVRSADVRRMARLGIVASIQPEHAMDDRELVAEHWPGREGAYRIRSLLRHGVRAVLGSDAPVTPLDPWFAIASAVTRARDGMVWEAGEAISLADALSCSARTSVAEGQSADLAVLDAELPTSAGISADPLAASDALRAQPVALTLVAGRVSHRAL